MCIYGLKITHIRALLPNEGWSFSEPSVSQTRVGSQSYGAAGEHLISECLRGSRMSTNKCCLVMMALFVQQLHKQRQDLLKCVA